VISPNVERENVSSVCDREEGSGFACVGQPFYGKDQFGEEYCVLHYPGDDKAETGVNPKSETTS
jgi:hypothetical protein